MDGSEDEFYDAQDLEQVKQLSAAAQQLKDVDLNVNKKLISAAADSSGDADKDTGEPLGNTDEEEEAKQGFKYTGVVDLNRA